jgi:hypothetical protein
MDAAALTQPMHRGHPPWPAPSSPPAAAPCYPRPDGLERQARPHTSGTTPSIIMSPGPGSTGPADRGKAGRPRHPRTLIPELIPEDPMT